MQLYAWQFRAARAATGLTVVELAVAADVGEMTVRRLEDAFGYWGDEPIAMRTNPRAKRPGGVDAALIAKVRKALHRHGYVLVPTENSKPAAVVKR